MKYEKFEQFKYFLECYFNASMDYSDLERLVEEFYVREKKEDIKAFKKEIVTLYELNDTYVIKEIIYKFAKRKFDNKAAKETITMFYNKVNELR